MFSVSSLIMILAAGIAAGSPEPGPPSELRVCADPNNLPFSNQQEEGFENEIARLLARDTGRKLAYVWWPQRRGFIRSTLKAGRCDLVMSVPSSFELAQPTRPYYRSSYVFVTRRRAHLDIHSLDDAILKKLKIGVHVIGDDYSNVPPAEALANRGLGENLVGYSIYGDYSEPNPPSAVINAVARGDIDVAIAWGPMAGYFASRSSTPLDIVPVSPQIDLPFLPFVFDISMGVRRGDDALRSEVDAFIVHHGGEIREILERYSVPITQPAVVRKRGSEVRQ